LNDRLADFLAEIQRKSDEARACYRSLLDKGLAASPHLHAGTSTEPDCREITRTIFARESSSAEEHPAFNLLVCDEQLRRSRRFSSVVSRIRQGILVHDEGCSIPFWIAETSVKGSSQQRWLSVGGVILSQKISRERRVYGTSAADHPGSSSACAQVPGRVVAVSAKAGRSYPKGSNLATLESMKMEFEVKAPFDLLVAEVHVAAGDLVKAGDLLVSWTAAQN
jgi:biotin carboxyl carrier protein